jgi:hypothetical protein
MGSADDVPPIVDPDGSIDAPTTGRPTPRRRSLRTVAVVFGAGAVLMTGLAVYLWSSADDEPTPELRDVTGLFTVVDEGYAGVAGPGCRAELSEGEVAGTSVFLVDGQGEQLASGTLGDGVKGAMFECRFSVTFPDVPDVTAYQLTVAGAGSSDVVPRSEMIEQGWVIALSSGSLGA